MTPWRPLVSVVIPTYNEERHIERCLASVMAQTYPADRMEIIVADGGSTDRTRVLVQEAARHDPRIRLVDNARRTQAAGLNVAIEASAGDVVARLDGHAAWIPEHVERCVDLLARTGADNVGGTMAIVGETPIGEAFAAATRTRLGAGGAAYRHADHECDVDTVWLGCFRRTALDRVGPFDERFPPHEDYELNHRLRTSGGRVVFSPDVPTTYWPRTSWSAVARQYFRYGRAKVRVARHRPGVVRMRHLAAPGVVAAAGLGAVAALFSRRARVVGGSCAGVYVATCVAAGLGASRGASAAVRVRVPAVVVLLHVAWGIGFWAGVVEVASPERRP
ncbi:MAG TPA: glycosyltransferase family 2 protein [Candidatus Dormibacteraeota bacterium]|nr:glycosyltransferase family 2 protein [Candidatus Dormibacteraeota bacterium]